MAEWIYVIHPPREEFADTMTAEEDPVIAGGFPTGELRPLRASLFRGRG